MYTWDETSACYTTPALSHNANLRGKLRAKTQASRTEAGTCRLSTVPLCHFSGELLKLYGSFMGTAGVSQSWECLQWLDRLGAFPGWRVWYTTEP